MPDTAPMTVRWPGRAAQIDRLVRVLGPPAAPVPPVFVGGLPSSGKTAVVRDLFQTLQLPHAYVNCVEASTPRHIFETILNQLHGHVPTASDSFAPHSKCGDMSRFIQLLAESVFPCPSAVETAPSSPARTADAAPPASPHASPPSADASTKAVELHAARVRLADGTAWSTEETRYIIFDNAERLRLMEKTVLPALLRLDQLTNRNICCVLISHVPYENFLAAAASTPMVCVDFEPYSKAQLTDILVRSCPHADLVQGYTEMIKLILNVFLDQHRELLELEQVAATAWPLVKTALDAGELAAGSADASKMYRLLKPVLRQSAARSLCLPAAILSLEQADSPYHTTGECGGGGGSSSSRAAGAAAAGGGLLDVELPYYSKHLLVAAFLASYNPPSRDVATFSLSSSGAMKKRKRGGRQGGRGKSLKDASGAPATASASADVLLQAPQTFGLERLLAIFYTLVVDPVDASVELLAEISGLVSLGLVRKIGNAEQLGDCKFSCRASYSLVQAVAASVRVELARFLHYDS